MKVAAPSAVLLVLLSVVAPLDAAAQTPAASATPSSSSYAGRPLAEALRMLQEKGLRILYSDDLVTPRMTVRSEPRARTAREILDEILKPWGLVAEPGPAGSLLVVRERRTLSAPAYGRVVGRVRSQIDQRPIAGAEIAVVDTRIATSTPSDGTFSTRPLPVGTYVLEARSPGFVPGRVEDVGVVADRMTAVSFDLAPIPTATEEVVVAPSLVQIRQNRPASTQLIARSEVDRTPHLGNDPFRLASLLPGTTPTDLSARFHVRGGEENELLVLYDGQELYNPFHFKNFLEAFTILDSRAIGGLDFSAGGFPAEYGNRLSAVLDLTTNPPSRIRRSSVGLSLLNAHLFSEGPFAGERGHWLASARYGFLKYALNLLDTSDFDPEYFDLFAKGQYAPTESTTLFADVLTAGDDIVVDSVEDDENLETRTRDLYGWAGARAVLPGGLFLDAIASAGRLTSSREGRFAEPTLAGTVDDRRSLRFFGLDQTWSFEPVRNHQARVGLAARRFSGSYDYESDRRIFVPTNLPPEVHRQLSLDPDGTEYSAWFSDRFEAAPSLTLELGLRWDRQTWAGDGDWSPRANVVWRLGKGSSIRAAWGRFVQPQRIHELQIEDGETQFGEAERAEHRIIGFEQTLPGGWGFRLEGYQKRMDRVRPVYETLFSRLDLFPELKIDRVRITADSAEAEGVELLVKREGWGRFSGWVSYALSSSQLTLEGEEYPRSWDQRHAFSANLNYRPGERWNVNAAWTWHSGWPITGVEAVLMDTPGGPQIGIFTTRYNSDRLPPYHRLDVRVSHAFPLGRGNLTAYLEVTNLYNRANPCCVDEFGVVVENGEPRIVRRYDTLIRMLPSFGIQWSF